MNNTHILLMGTDVYSQSSATLRLTLWCKGFSFLNRSNFHNWFSSGKVNSEHYLVVLCPVRGKTIWNALFGSSGWHKNGALVTPLPFFLILMVKKDIHVYTMWKDIKEKGRGRRHWRNLACAMHAVSVRWWEVLFRYYPILFPFNRCWIKEVKYLSCPINPVLFLLYHIGIL